MIGEFLARREKGIQFNPINLVTVYFDLTYTSILDSITTESRKQKTIPNTFDASSRVHGVDQRAMFCEKNIMEDSEESANV